MINNLKIAIINYRLEILKETAILVKFFGIKDYIMIC